MPIKFRLFAFTPLVTLGFVSILLWNLNTLPSVVHAQSDVPPFLQITGIDTSQFPSVTVSLYGENLGTTLDVLDVTLREDKLPRPHNGGILVDVGIQTALVLDASNSIRASGLIDGRPRYAEFQFAVDTLLDSNFLSAETDWLAAFATGATQDDFRLISDWTQDHGALRNDVLLFSPEDDNAQTPLFDLIEFVLRHFADSGAPPNMMKSIIVFSDGFDITSDLDERDVVRQAAAMDVRIYTVMVGPTAPDRQSNLERIAKLSNGHFTLLDTVAALDPLWDALKQQRQQLAVTYRASKAQPQEIEIEAAVGTQLLIRRGAFPVVGIEPMQVAIVSPLAGTHIERRAPSLDTPLADMTPRALPIELAFTWPDGVQRRIQRVEFSLNDDTRILESGPFDKFLFPIADLSTGRYTLRVTALDELGQESKANPVSLEIAFVIPPSPPPTLPPPSTPTPLPPTPLPTAPFITTQSPATISTPLTLPSLGATTRSIALLALATLFVIWGFFNAWRQQLDERSSAPELMPEGRNAATAAQWGNLPGDDGGLDEATEIPAEPPFQPMPAAHLLAVNQLPHLPERIVFHIGAVVRIGRRADLCDVVLDDKRISRAHAIFTHREDGFYIQDDGSKGGTYVNQRRLSVSDDRLLRTGDIINFHAIAYRFELIEDDQAEVAETLFDQRESPRTGVNGFATENPTLTPTSPPRKRGRG